MPGPSSATVSRTKEPDTAPRHELQTAPRTSAWEASRASRPRAPTASRALTARLNKTWCRATGFAATGGTPPAAPTSRVRVAGRLARRNWATSRSTGPTATAVGGASALPRLKARSCATSSRARSAARRTASRWRGASAPASRASSARPRMTASRLLKSWATPPARRPMDSIFWASWSWISRRCCSSRARSRAVTSWAETSRPPSGSSVAEPSTATPSARVNRNSAVPVRCRSKGAGPASAGHRARARARASRCSGPLVATPQRALQRGFARATCPPGSSTRMALAACSSTEVRWALLRARAARARWARRTATASRPTRVAAATKRPIRFPIRRRRAARPWAWRSVAASRLTSREARNKRWKPGRRASKASRSAT